MTHFPPPLPCAQIVSGSLGCISSPGTPDVSPVRPVLRYRAEHRTRREAVPTDIGSGAAVVNARVCGAGKCKPSYVPAARTPRQCTNLLSPAISKLTAQRRDTASRRSVIHQERGRTQCRRPRRPPSFLRPYTLAPLDCQHADIDTSPLQLAHSAA